MSDSLHERATFKHHDIVDILNRATPDQLDQASFGVVGLQRGGRVTVYNRFEEQLAGLSRDDVLGKDFFVDIAPCTNNFMVRERFIGAWDGDGVLDEQVPYTFSYRMKATKVRLRLLVRDSSAWLLVNVND